MTTIDEIEALCPQLKRKAAGNPTATEYVKHIRSNIRLYKKAADENERTALLEAMHSNFYWLRRELAKK